MCLTRSSTLFRFGREHGTEDTKEQTWRNFVAGTRTVSMRIANLFKIGLALRDEEGQLECAMRNGDITLNAFVLVKKK